MDLKSLNKGMLFAGRLSEIHEKNLKTYPFLVFDHLDTAILDYNLNKWLNASQDNEIIDPEPYVKYILVFETAPPKNFEELASILKRTVKTFLFKEVEVIVSIGGKDESAYGRNEEPATYSRSALKAA